MSKNEAKKEAEFLDELRSLSITAAHELLSGVDRLKALREEVRDGDELRKETEPKRKKVNDLAFELARSEIRRAETLLSLSHEQADLMFAHARALIRKVRSKGEEPRAVVELIVSKTDEGFAGSAQHTIRNPFAALADYRFHLEAPTDRAGEKSSLEKKLTLECLPQRVQPHGEATVRISFSAARADEVPVGVFFGRLDVYLSADIERLVSQLLVKIRVEQGSSQ